MDCYATAAAASQINMTNIVVAGALDIRTGMLDKFSIALETIATSTSLWAALRKAAIIHCLSLLANSQEKNWPIIGK